MLYIDNRWSGNHGIARYAREILLRLPSDFALQLPASGHPAANFDFLSTSRLRLSRSDTIYTPGFNAGLTRAQQVLTVHDLIHLNQEVDGDFKKVAYYWSIVRPAIERAGLVFTVSSTSASAIRTWLTAPDVEVVVTGNGCSRSFAPRERGVERSGPPKFVFVGSSKVHKNLSVILRALKQRPGYCLTVVSGDPSVGRLIRDNGVNLSQIEVHAGLEDEQLAELYRESAGLLMPSIVEGFGLPALEAIHCGSPVAYWAGCESVREIVEHRGVAVGSALDESEWAEAMDTLVHSDRIQLEPEWKLKYDWEEVAATVSTKLREYTNERA